MPLYKWKSTPIRIPIPHLDFVFHALEYNNHELQFLVCMSPFRGLSSYFKAVFIFEVVFIFELCMPTYAEKMTIFRQKRVHHKKFDFCSFHYILTGLSRLWLQMVTIQRPLGLNLSVPSRIYSTLDGNGRPHDGNQVNWAILGVLLPCQKLTG